MRTRAALSGLLIALAFGSGTTLAQDKFPNRTVTIVVPTTPGAITDIMARAIAQSMSEEWKQSVIVDNKPGANELIGSTFVAKSKPDGYTLLVTSNAPITALPHIHKNMPFDPLKDLTPIVMLGHITPVMIVPAKSPAKSVADVIAMAKKNPGGLNYGSFGVGAYSHVAMEDFMRRTGISMMHLPHRGAAPAYLALLRNDTVVMFANLASATGYEQSDDVRIIAAAGPQRSSIRPELPTVAESGAPGFSTGAWWGLFGPANMPAELSQKIRSDVSAMLNSPNMKKILVTNTMERQDMTGPELAEFIQKDVAHWAKQVESAGLKPQ